MAGVADQDHVPPFAGISLDLDMDLGDQWAGRVEHGEPTRGGARAHRLGDAVCGENAGRAVGNLVDFFDEDRALGTQIIDDEAVVHHLVTDVDRRAQSLEGTLDDFDRTIDAGAEPARIGKQDFHQPPPAG